MNVLQIRRSDERRHVMRSPRVVRASCTSTSNETLIVRGKRIASGGALDSQGPGFDGQAGGGTGGGGTRLRSSHTDDHRHGRSMCIIPEGRGFMLIVADGHRYCGSGPCTDL